MPTPWKKSLTLALLVVGVAPLLALGDAATSALECNRWLLDRWNADPEHRARLQRDLQAFSALPEVRRTQIRELDEALHQLGNDERQRLGRVMERYGSWLERLPAERRQQIDSAPDARYRLEVIREIRMGELMARLPLPERERLQTVADPKQRWAKLLEVLERDRKREKDWLDSLRPRNEAPRRPTADKLSAFPEDVQAFVKQSLYPVLSQADRARLDGAEGHGPIYGRTLVELADRYAYALPVPPKAARRFQDLPPELRKLVGAKLADGNLRRRLAILEGSWPQFALALTEAVRQRGVKLPTQLGPCRPSELPPEVRLFLQEKLLPQLSSEDRAYLNQSEGLWPDYPQTLVRLARLHGLWIPGMMMPGPRPFWEPYRVEAPAGRTERQLALGLATP